MEARGSLTIHETELASWPYRREKMIQFGAITAVSHTAAPMTGVGACRVRNAGRHDGLLLASWPCGSRPTGSRPTGHGPERPSIFVRLREQIEEYPVRQRVKPGITGLAQMCHPYDSCLDDVRRTVHFDIEYLTRQSLATDMAIMARTVPVMLFRIGGW